MLQNHSSLLCSKPFRPSSCIYIKFKLIPQDKMPSMGGCACLSDLGVCILPPPFGFSRMAFSISVPSLLPAHARCHHKSFALDVFSAGNVLPLTNVSQPLSHSKTICIPGRIPNQSIQNLQSWYPGINSESPEWYPGTKVVLVWVACLFLSFPGDSLNSPA